MTALIMLGTNYNVVDDVAVVLVTISVNIYFTFYCRKLDCMQCRLWK